MKKLVRLTALLLAGALLVLMTACGAAPLNAEQKAKKDILKAINDYRAELKLEQLEEVAELSAAEKVWTDAFRAAGNVELPFDEKLYDAYDAKINCLLYTSPSPRDRG